MFRFLRSPLLAVCGISLLLSGCSTVSGWFSVDEDDGKAPAELMDFTTEVKIRKLWSIGVGSGQGSSYNHLKPALNGGTLYAAGNDGVVLALETSRGKRQWSQDFDIPFSGGVGYGEGMVLLGTSDGEVLALSANDGTEIWRAQMAGEVLAAPQTDGKIVVVQTYDGRLHGLNAADGTEAWVYDSNLPVLTLRGTSSPIIFEKLVMAAFGNGKVVAFELATGATRWEARVAIAQGRSEIDRIVDIDGNMVLLGTTLFAVSYQGRLAAIDIPSGRKLWQQEVSSYTGVDQGFGNIYVAAENGEVIAFQRTGQGERWRNADLLNRRLNAPRVIKGYVAVADLEGYVHFISQVDGRIVGRTSVDSSGVRADMLVDGNVIYVFGNSGNLAALQVSGLDKK